MPTFNVTFAWVYKWDDIHHCLATAIQAYIDDLRLYSRDNFHVQRLLRHLAATLQWLGIQDAARKRTAPNYGTTPWAGSISSTLDGQVSHTVSQERWMKVGVIVKALIVALGMPITQFDNLWSTLVDGVGGGGEERRKPLDLRDHIRASGAGSPTIL